MKKTVIFLVCIFCLLVFPKITLAEDDFYIDVDANYKFLESGKVDVTLSFVLENANDNQYASSYQLNLNNISPEEVTAMYLGENIPVSVEKSGDTNYLKVDFDDYVIGEGKKRKFIINFLEPNFANRTGEVWELSIPRLADNSFRSFAANLTIPHYFGKLAFMSPQPSSVDSGNESDTYKFKTGLLSKTGITAGFGNFQVFSFNLKYHLENDQGLDEISIALPPDTSLQRVFYQSIDPLPKNISLDLDGNWIAKYEIEKGERVDVVVIGSVQIFSTPLRFRKSQAFDLNENLKEQKYWETNDENIKNIANDLKTPYEIYKFVSEYLTYDYSRVRPEAKRLGALEALKNPDSVICMEFTDLFIAIARSAGIPAREINGFAYTENPEIQPLSLVADVLHAWPEYWDTETNQWIAIDPTWTSTTGGVDYFNKLDLRHFTFVIHGSSSENPLAPGSYKLGSNPQKDVFVTFGKLESNIQKLQIKADNLSYFPLIKQKLQINLRNPGPTARYDLEPKIFFDNTLTKQTNIDVLLPYNNQNIVTYIPNSLFLKNIPNEVLVVVGNSELTIPINKERVLLNNLIFVFVSSILIILIILNRLGRFNPSIFLKKIRKT